MLSRKTSDKLSAALKIILAIAFVCGAAFRFYGAGWGLPSELSLDETHFVPRAIRFGTGDLNPHFFLYPSLYMYMLFALYAAYFVVGLAGGAFHSAADFAVQYFLDPSPFYIIGRSFAAALNLFTAVLVFAAARRLFSSAAAFAAAVMFLFSPLCVTQSHFITADSPLAFFAALSVYFMVRIVESGERKHYLLAGAALGLAAAVKYTAGLLVPVLFAAHVLYALGRPGPKLKNVFLNGNLYLAAPAAYAAFFAGCPYHLLDFASYRDAIESTMKTTSGFWLGLENVRNMWAKIIFDYLAHGLGPHVLILSFAGIVLSAAKKNRGGLLLSFFVVFYYLFMGRYAHYSFDRYWLFITPALCVLAGAALAAAAAKISGFSEKHSTALLAAAVLVCAAANVPAIAGADRGFALPYTQNIARSWIEENIPAGSRMALEAGGPQLTGSLQTHLDAASRTFDPRDVNPEAEKFNKLGTSAGSEPSNVSVTGKKYLRMALERKKPQYYIFGAFTLGSFTLDYYERNNYEYLIVNSGTRDRYLAAPRVYPRTVAFYKSLEKESRPIKTFSPVSGRSAGPTIRIYSLEKH